MTHVGPAPIGASATPTAVVGSSFVEWGAVLAGAVLAAAISFVLLTFGAAIGLSAASPWPNSGASAKVVASIAVFWAMAQQIGAFMAGGYVAGRMRSRWHEAGHEAEFRDGLHGGLVWAVGVVIGAALFLSTAGSVGKNRCRSGRRSGGPGGVFDERSHGRRSRYADCGLQPSPRRALRQLRLARVTSGGLRGSTCARSCCRRRAPGRDVPRSIERRGQRLPDRREPRLPGAARLAARRHLAAGSREACRPGVQYRTRGRRQGAPRGDPYRVCHGRKPGPLARRRMVGRDAGRAPSRQLDPGQVRSSATRAAELPPQPRKESPMLRDIVLWMAGVPIFVIILLHLFGVLH